MKTWGFGVIGCGNIAEHHIKSIRDISGAQLNAVSSRKSDRAKEVGTRENCFYTTDYKELLARTDVDVVCVTTSSGSHAPIGIEALKAGKHVIVEKPFSMTVEEADEMIGLAREKDLKIGVIFQRRFEQLTQQMKQSLDSGEIGKLLFVEAFTPSFRSQAYYDSADWRGTLAEDGGALMNQGIHQIDLMLFFAGEVRSVQGRVATQTHDMEAEDIGLAIVTFANNALGMVMSSTSIVPGFPDAVHLYGSTGTMKLQGGTLTIWKDGEESPVSYGKKELQSSTSFRNPMDFSYYEHRSQIQDFVRALEENRAPAVTGEDGKGSVQLVKAIYESSRTGNAVIYR